MRHLPITEVAHRLVREIACTKCYQRPAGSETLGPEVARPCEMSCALFFHLPTLVRLAGQVGDAPGACETAVKESVCGRCRLTATAGEFCGEYATRSCPLSRYSGDVLCALPRVLSTHSDSDGGGPS